LIFLRTSVFLDSFNIFINATDLTTSQCSLTQTPFCDLFGGNLFKCARSAGFPRGLESIEKVLNFKTGFQDQKY